MLNSNNGDLGPDDNNDVGAHSNTPINTTHRDEDKSETKYVLLIAVNTCRVKTRVYLPITWTILLNHLFHDRHVSSRDTAEMLLKAM